MGHGVMLWVNKSQNKKHLEKSRLYKICGAKVGRSAAGCSEDVRVRGERVRGRWGALS